MIRQCSASLIHNYFIFSICKIKELIKNTIVNQNKSTTMLNNRTIFMERLNDRVTAIETLLQKLEPIEGLLERLTLLEENIYTTKNVLTFMEACVYHTKSRIYV